MLIDFVFFIWYDVNTFKEIICYYYRQNQLFLNYQEFRKTWFDAGSEANIYSYGKSIKS